MEKWKKVGTLITVRRKTKFFADSSAEARVSSHSASGGCKVKYAFIDGAKWTLERVTTVNSGYSTCLAIYSKDRLHIAYQGSQADFDLAAGVSDADRN